VCKLQLATTSQYSVTSLSVMNCKSSREVNKVIYRSNVVVQFSIPSCCGWSHVDQLVLAISITFCNCCLWIFWKTPLSM